MHRLSLTTVLLLLLSHSTSTRYERCVDFQLLKTHGSAERQPWIKLRGGSDFDSSSRLKRSSGSDRYKLTSSENLSDETTEDETPQDQMIPDEDMTIDLHHEELELPKDVRVVINKQDKKIEVLDHHSVHVRHTTGNPRPRYPLKVIEVPIPFDVRPGENFTFVVAGHGALLLTAPSQINCPIPCIGSSNKRPHHMLAFAPTSSPFPSPIPGEPRTDDPGSCLTSFRGDEDGIARRLCDGSVLYPGETLYAFPGSVFFSPEESNSSFGAWLLPPVNEEECCRVYEEALTRDRQVTSKFQLLNCETAAKNGKSSARTTEHCIVSRCEADTDATLATHTEGKFAPSSFENDFSTAGTICRMCISRSMKTKNTINGSNY
mmetsp:Transcript_31197/g.100092  ORF Transcript_31197/g.100092 Transcript_31197/m.100092 type:complete len:376 (+) Transcript_31197:105-1232(+)